MDKLERAAFKEACREVFRPMLEADVVEAEQQLRRVGGEMLSRAEIIRDIRCRAPEAMARLRAAAPAGLPPDEELRIRFEVFNELMNELAARAVN